MLYVLHELQRSILNPFSAFTDAESLLFSHPYSPLAYTPLSRPIAASYELMHRLGKDYGKPQWGIASTKVDELDVNVCDSIVLETPFCSLVHFKRELDPARPADPKVLLVAPLSGHYATLLRDTVKALLPQHEIYITDWKNARDVPQEEGEFSLDDYVHYVQDFIRFLGQDVHVISVCQPTVPVLAAISLMAANKDPCTPANMIMMGGPIDTRESPTEVNELAMTKPYSWFENQLIHRVPARHAGSGRLVYPGFLQHTGFIAMNPSRHVQSHYDYFLQMIEGDNEDAQTHRRFYDEYNAVLDLPAKFYLDTIRTVFQDFLLPLGLWKVDGQLVEPSAITNTSLLTIEGELDDISGLGQTHAAHKLCANIPAKRKQAMTVKGAGHYGIFSGRRWREIVCPEITRFIRKSK